MNSRVLSRFLVALFLGTALPLSAGEAADPPEIVLGETLFLETRFAEFFARNAVDVNTPLEQGDPALDATQTVGGDLMGPFRGKSINCRACHLVDEFAETPEQPGAPQGGMRTYADFAARPPVPRREDGLTVALRNSPSQVNASVGREFTFFHADGEFVTMEDLVLETMVGRNFGWLRNERAEALAHCARVIREDEGRHPLALEDPALAHLSYGDLLAGTSAALPEELTLPPEYRIDIQTADDGEVLNAVAKLIAVYVTDLSFSRDEQGYNLSPYDVFLRKNSLPTQPAEGEEPIDYSRRLARALDALAEPAFVTEEDGAYASHDHPFRFGPSELVGLKTFLREPAPGEAAVDCHAGNCVVCHPAPHFTDFLFHNTGAIQEEYDAIHGAGAFARVAIPGLKARQELFEAHGQSGTWQNPFAAVPSLDAPGHMDLGLWNVFQNPDLPKPQPQLSAMFARLYPAIGTPEAMLEKSIALFKTPGLRDLGHSDPYFHTGRFPDLESVMHFYRQVGAQARAGTICNADPELSGICIDGDDARELVAFVRALDEDYE